MSEMALTWRLVTGCGGGMADARNVASPAACASSGSRHAPHAGALPSPTLSPTDPVPQGPLTLWARAGPVYAYMYVCVHVHARAHARTHTHHIYNGSATAQKKDGEGAANSTPRVYGRSRATAPRRPTSASVAGKHTMCKHTGRGAGKAGRAGRGDQRKQPRRKPAGCARRAPTCGRQKLLFQPQLRAGGQTGAQTGGIVMDRPAHILHRVRLCTLRSPRRRRPCCSPCMCRRRSPGPRSTPR